VVERRARSHFATQQPVRVELGVVPERIFAVIRRMEIACSIRRIHGPRRWRTNSIACCPIFGNSGLRQGSACFTAVAVQQMGQMQERLSALEHTLQAQNGNRKLAAVFNR
jgi:hypothetical protein